MHYEPRLLDPQKEAAGIEARSLSDPGLKEFLESLRMQPEATWPRTNWDFDSLTLAAFYFHPDLDVARAAWKRARAGEISAGARPNPTLSVGPQYAVNSASGITPWLAFVDLDVPIETAGKRKHRLSQARELSTAARLDLISRSWEVRSRIYNSLFNVIHAARRTQALQAQVRIQEEILRRLEQKLSAGTISRPDLLLHRSTLQRSRLDLAEASAVSTEARVDVASAIALPVSALEDVRLPETWPDLTSQIPRLTSSEVRRAAVTSRADVLAALAGYEATQAALQLEIARQYPDLKLGPGYEYDQGENKFGLRLGAELPLLNHNQGPIAQAVAAREEAAARMIVTQTRVLAEVDAAFASWRAAAGQTVELETGVEVERQRVLSLKKQIEVGAAEPLDLLTGQLELARAEWAQQEGELRQQRALARLEQEIQSPIDVDLTRGFRQPFNPQ